MSCGATNLPKDVEWTLESVNQTAMEFAENVVAAPIKTQCVQLATMQGKLLIAESAILKTYTTLSSFDKTDKKGFSPNHRNASIYGKRMMAHYFEYKSIFDATSLGRHLSPQTLLLSMLTEL